MKGGEQKMITIETVEELNRQKDPRLPAKPLMREASPGQYIGEGWGAPEPGEYTQWLKTCIDIPQTPIVIDRLRPDDG